MPDITVDSISNLKILEETIIKATEALSAYKRIEKEFLDWLSINPNASIKQKLLFLFEKIRRTDLPNPTHPDSNFSRDGVLFRSMVQDYFKCAGRILLLSVFCSKHGLPIEPVIAPGHSIALVKLDE